MAAITDFINEDREDHILTLEDPIEYILNSKNCHVNQREIHAHTESFPKALRGALREDPDIIVVGEMRDLETISLALTAAETGHLVLATLHTGNAPRTLDRILDVFPVDQREQIRIMVSESLRGIISQQLVPRIDGSGRELALELLVNTPAVANCIREGKTYMLPGVMQTGKNVGMITMDDSLRELYNKGTVAQEEVLFRCEDKAVMRAWIPLDAIVCAGRGHMGFKCFDHFDGCPVISLCHAEVHFSADFVSIEMGRIFSVSAESYAVERSRCFDAITHLCGSSEGKRTTHTIAGAADCSISGSNL